MSVFICCSSIHRRRENFPLNPLSTDATAIRLTMRKSIHRCVFIDRSNSQNGFWEVFQCHGIGKELRLQAYTTSSRIVPPPFSLGLLHEISGIELYPRQICGSGHGNTGNKAFQVCKLPYRTAVIQHKIVVIAPAEAQLPVLPVNVPVQRLLCCKIKGRPFYRRNDPSGQGIFVIFRIELCLQSKPLSHGAAPPLRSK